MRASIAKSRGLCLLKSPFLLLRLMLQRIVDTLLNDDVRPPLTAPDPTRELRARAPHSSSRCSRCDTNCRCCSERGLGGCGSRRRTVGSGSGYPASGPGGERRSSSSDPRRSSRGTGDREWSPRRTDGISHRHSWTRDQGVKFFVDVNGSNPDEVASEVDRYCSWPGQACGYKVGHSEINRQRQKATTALGPRFDVKAFNDTVVLGGNVPLDVPPRTSTNMCGPPRASCEWSRNSSGRVI